jgi:cob(I)alamin adenosyltransferase
MAFKVKSKGVVTKKGDTGYTYVYSGDRLNKGDLRLEAIGTLDELNAFLGMAKSLIIDKNGKCLIETVQKDLFVLGTQFSKGNFKGLEKRISRDRIRSLEDEIEKLEKRFRFKGFVMPGDNLSSSVFHVARSVARHLEYKIVILKNRKILQNKNILIYLNRLSDLLFLLACKYSLKKRLVKF